ncbi:MAG: S-methyl-5'-thioadenosine phosphorylase [Methanosarcinaceae archaeon]|nr:S-methyl-5'-thioadenosine phosphorylase [Methanosarcinaceae archaeon]
MQIQKERLNQQEQDSEISAVILGGVGFTSFEDCKSRTTRTPYGNVNTYICEMKKLQIAIIPRHVGTKKNTPPHRINYRANLWAAKELGAKRVISTNSVGTMKNHPIGSFVILDDFLDFTRNRVSTFFDNETVHVDMVKPYCPEIKKCLSNSLEKRGIEYDEGIYICTEGPRFETRAEINMMRQFGDVVGMTGVPEVILAKELELCYASICTVTNCACGMSDEKLTVDEVIETLKGVQNVLFGVISDAISNIPVERECMCCYATKGARL